MDRETRYCGKVVRVGVGSADVAVTRHSGCATCKAATACKATERKAHVVTAAVPEAMTLEIGQTVGVAVPSHSGIRSVALGYGLPLVAFVVCCALAHFCGQPDVVAACAGFVAVAVYYLALFFMRGKMAGLFSARVVERME